MSTSRSPSPVVPSGLHERGGSISTKLSIQIDAPPPLRDRIRSVLDHAEASPGQVVVSGGHVPRPTELPRVWLSTDSPSASETSSGLAGAHAVAEDLSSLPRAIGLAWLRQDPTRDRDPQWLATCRAVTGAESATIVADTSASHPAWVIDAVPRALLSHEPVMANAPSGLVGFCIATTAGVLCLESTKENAHRTLETLWSERSLWGREAERVDRTLRDLEHALRSPAFVVRLAARVLAGQQGDPALVRRLEVAAQRVLDATTRARDTLQDPTRSP